MKVEQPKRPYTPVTVTFESEVELKVMINALQACAKVAVINGNTYSADMVHALHERLSKFVENP